MSQDPDRLMLELQKQTMEQVRQQFSDTILEHWMNPRNPGVMHNPDGRARIKGPCGDTMEIFLRVAGDTIVEARFLTDGCMTTIVSASMAVELATGKPTTHALDVSQEAILEALGGMPQESEHCALLAADTLRAAIDDFLCTKKASWKRPYR